MNGLYRTRIMPTDGVRNANEFWKKSLNSILKKRSLGNRKSMNENKKNYTMMLDEII